MAITFKYKKIKRPDNSEIKTPSIPVTLGGGGGRYDFIALVDSGAWSQKLWIQIFAHFKF